MDYGTLFGALFSSAAQVYNNHANVDLQKETNKANLLAQQEANALQVDLANTSHQREVLDLKAAGLNPILSAGGSGASTPSIGTAQQVAPKKDSLSQQMSEIGRAASSAADADRRLKYQQIENLRSQDDNLKSQNFNLEQDGKLKAAQAKAAEVEGRIAEYKLRGLALAESGVNSARKAGESFMSRGAAEYEREQSFEEAMDELRDDKKLDQEVVYEAARKGVSPKQVDRVELFHRLKDQVEREHHRGKYRNANFIFTR